jgi:enoyl-CoA hydratase
MKPEKKSDCIDVEILSGGVAVITLNRPPANALDTELLTQFCDHLDALSADAGVRALVIAGSGKAFCAGVDLKSVVAYDRAQQQAMVNGLNRMVHTVYGFCTPTVAAVNGHAIAGGMVLALCCDTRIGPEEVGLYGLAEVRVAIPFPFAAAEVVRAELSPGDARNIALFGTNMGPNEALSRGVFDALQPADQVKPSAIARAQALAKLPPNGFLTIKQQVRGPALERIAKVIADKSDPLLDNWITDESRVAAAAILAGRG